MTDLLFIHGFGASPKIWDLQIKEFSRDFNVITDIEDFDPGKLTIVVGWSMGALKAIDLYFKYPENVKGLVLVSAFPKFLRSLDYTQGLPPVMLRNLEKKIDDNLESGLKFFYELLFPDKNMHNLMREIKTPNREETFADIEKLKVVDIREKLKDIAVPTLMIHGSFDPIVPVESAEYMADNIPNSELQIFEGVGHVPFLERTKYFNSLLKTFIKANVK